VLAVSFDRDGGTVLAAGASALAESPDGLVWRSRLLPVRASPTRELVSAGSAGGFYLLGWQGLFYTEDAGGSWSERATRIPTVTRLLVSQDSRDTLYALAAGDVWLSRDGGREWEPRNSGLPRGQVETLAFDLEVRPRFWAGGADRIYRTDDAGVTWETAGRALPEAETHIRAIAPQLAVDSGRTVLSTDRGLYLSQDGGSSWDLLSDNLPGHIEAGPLVLSKGPRAALYAGFSVTPYDELWRSAASGGTTLARLGPSEVAGGAAFLVIVGLGAWLALRWLVR
jgi:photosystem II stability/assembly factor-like uncharacterized protein